MQKTSALYKTIVADTNHWFEVSLTVGDRGVLVDRTGNRITFGTGANKVGIYTSAPGADGGYKEDELFSLRTYRNVFSKNEPTVGCCVSGEIKVDMVAPKYGLQKKAMMIPYVRACNKDGHSEWIKKGVYFTDTRETTAGKTDDQEVLTIHGYDQMLQLDTDFPFSDKHDYPCSDIQIIEDIKEAFDFEVDERTMAVLTEGYTIEIPTGYNCRDTLGYIAALYGGNFLFNDDGMLQLVQFGDIPRETRYLIDQSGYVITIGGDRIIV